jgi:hypothetical protein
MEESMKYKPVVSVLCVIVLLGLLLPGSAQAQDTAQPHDGSYRIVDATFTHVDLEACIITKTNVSTMIAAYKQPGNRRDNPVLGSARQTLYSCEDGRYLDSYSETVFNEAVSSSIDPALKKASLKVSVPLRTFAGEPVKTLYVDIQWTGVGELTRYKDRSRSDRCLEIVSMKQAYRQAAAWGSISDGQTEFAQAFESGEFYEVDTHSVTKGCYGP